MNCLEENLRKRRREKIPGDMQLGVSVGLAYSNLRRFFLAGPKGRVLSVPYLSANIQFPFKYLVANASLFDIFLFHTWVQE
jgi:hypothetical protein